MTLVPTHLKLTPSVEYLPQPPIQFDSNPVIKFEYPDPTDENTTYVVARSMHTYPAPEITQSFSGPMSGLTEHSFPEDVVYGLKGQVYSNHQMRRGVKVLGRPANARHNQMNSDLVTLLDIITSYEADDEVEKHVEVHNLQSATMATISEILEMKASGVASLAGSCGFEVDELALWRSGRSRDGRYPDIEEAGLSLSALASEYMRTKFVGRLLEQDDGLVPVMLDVSEIPYGVESDAESIIHISKSGVAEDVQLEALADLTDKYPQRRKVVFPKAPELEHVAMPIVQYCTKVNPENGESDVSLVYGNDIHPDIAAANEPFYIPTLNQVVHPNAVLGSVLLTRGVGTSTLAQAFNTYMSHNGAARYAKAHPETLAGVLPALLSTNQVQQEILASESFDRLYNL